ncbi:peptidoglycan D,D-transpeptidase FtsI family protein [Parvularcula marina]|uniref:peptidoglycan D,D-transpeptidase FtsI family protein n=1 Tax=Parvularcula marina TaxID=2292771 RepID=UPI0035133F8B
MRADGLKRQISVRCVYDDRRPCKPPQSRVVPAEGGRRIGLSAGLFACAFALLAARLVQVSFFVGEDPTLRRVVEAEGPRREVTDRDGRPLIMNAKLTGFAIDGREVWDVEETLRGVARIFPQADEYRLRDRLAAHKYAHVTDTISEEQRAAIIALGLPGMRFPETMGRVYPQKGLAAHVTGYTIPGRGGAIGVEAALESDTFGATAKEPLRLSIDLVAQQILEEELAGAIETFSAKAGWGVMIDVHTGEVAALASLPDFNPNAPGDVPAAHWRNRAMADRYELGSAFKPITVAAALDRGVIRMSDSFDVSRPIKVGGWEIKDYSRKKPVMSVSEIIQHSSNIGTVQIVQRLGAEAFEDSLSQLHLTTALQTELPEMQAPAYSSAWRPAELASTSYGHGIAVTPIQLAAAFAAVVNGGEYRVPTFIAGHEQKGTQVFSKDTSDQMRIILRRAVTDGTGRNADLDGYYVIGKTATADKPQAGGYDEENGELVSSFIGAFPGYDPKYVLLVSIDEPAGTKATYGYATAGYVAAPVFRRVVERAAPALGVMPVGDDVAFDGFLGLRRAEIAELDHQADPLTGLLEEALR